MGSITDTTVVLDILEDTMLIAARTFAFLAVLMTALAFSVARRSLPRVGFEGALYLSGLHLWVSVARMVVTCCLCLMLVAKRRRAGLIGPVMCSVGAATILIKRFGAL